MDGYYETGLNKLVIDQPYIPFSQDSATIMIFRFPNADFFEDYLILVQEHLWAKMMMIEPTGDIVEGGSGNDASCQSNTIESKTSPMTKILAHIQLASLIFLWFLVCLQKQSSHLLMPSRYDSQLSNASLLYLLI